mgnify:CR=1 FL=1
MVILKLSERDDNRESIKNETRGKWSLNKDSNNTRRRGSIPFESVMFLSRVCLLGIPRKMKVLKRWRNMAISRTL